MCFAVSGREAAARRRQPAAPRLLLQRPSGRRPRRGRRAARAVHRARAREARRAGARDRPVGGRAGASPTRRPRIASPTSCERLSLEVVTLNGFPYKAFHAAVVKRDVYWPHWAQDDRREYTLGLARLLAKLLPDDVADGLDLDAAARLARGLGRRDTGRGAARAGRPRRRARGDRARDRQEDPAGARARARLHGRDDRPGVRRDRRTGARLDRRLPRRLPPRGAVRGPGRGGRAARREKCPDRQDTSLIGASRAVSGHARGPRTARALRRAEVPAPGARVRELARRGRRTTCPRRSRAPCRRSASGACTSTCRSTRPSTPRRTS